MSRRVIVIDDAGKLAAAHSVVVTSPDAEAARIIGSGPLQVQLEDEALAVHAAGSRTRCAATRAGGRPVGLLVRLEIRRLLQFVLAHGDLQLGRGTGGGTRIARDDLEGGRRKRHVLRADAKEATDANY